MKKLILIILILIPLEAHSADKWTTEDIALQGIFTGLMIVDYKQTLQIAENPRNLKIYCTPEKSDSEAFCIHERDIESNHFLGKAPSKAEVNMYFLLTTLGHTAITHILPQEYRKYWQMFWIGFEVEATSHNYNVGINIQF